jgi:hypothetical protein
LAWITWPIYRSCADEKTAAIHFTNLPTQEPSDMFHASDRVLVAIAITDRPAPPDALRNPDLDTVRGAIERLGGPRPTQVGLQKGLRTVE